MLLRSIALAVVVLFAVTTGKPNSLNQSQAVRVDEFGDVQSSDAKARLDFFVTELQKSPNAKAFVIVYRSIRDMPGLSYVFAWILRNYLVSMRGIPRDRVVTVDGGASDCLVQELWIVPPGSAPTPRQDAKIGNFIYSEVAWKFYEYDYLTPQWYRKYPDSKPLPIDDDFLDAYATEIRKQNSTIACIIAYAQYRSKADGNRSYEEGVDLAQDPPGSARKRLLEEQRVLTKTYGIPASRIRMIDGGYRKRRMIELWVVPAGESMPVPTPNVFRSLRKPG